MFSDLCLGIGIGDGWTDPVSHMKTYGEYVLSTGLGDLSFVNYLDNIHTQFKQLVNQGNYAQASSLVLQVMTIIGDLNTTNPWISIYNYRNNSEGIS